MSLKDDIKKARAITPTTHRLIRDKKGKNTRVWHIVKGPQSWARYCTDFIHTGQEHADPGVSSRPYRICKQCFRALEQYVHELADLVIDIDDCHSMWEDEHR